jgi:trehalose-6-phosphate synthase
MRLSARLSFALIFGVASVSLIFAYYQTQEQTRELKEELTRHAQTLAESLAKSAEPLAAAHSNRELQRLVDRYQEREQVAGTAIYGLKAEPLAVSVGLSPRLNGSIPAAVTQALANDEERGDFTSLGNAPAHVEVVPLVEGGTLLGALALFQDSSYIDLQSAALWQHALWTVAIQTALIVLITLLTIRWGLGQPVRRLTQWLREQRLATGDGAAPVAAIQAVPEAGDFEPLTLEVSRMATSLAAARAAAEQEARLRESADSNWTAERLRVFIQSRLAGDRLLVVSNREPYEHRYTGSEIECVAPASGLVTALEPVLRACDGVWIAQATGNADRETSDFSGHLRVPPDHPQYTLRRVWLTEQEEQGFYYGFANEGLWPLCHIAHTRPSFRREDWDAYRAVNQKFASALLEEMQEEEHPVALLQDYHFALLPRIIKDRRRDARVAIFWHIPWPNPEAFDICPWARELLNGLLGADLIGFHIQAHCNNFLETVDRSLESRIDWERFSVNRNAHVTLVRPIPISVECDPTKAPPDSELPYLERSRLLAAQGLRASFLGVGVDRIDYTKGIPERFRGIERFLEKCPAYRGEFTFVQIGSPSRTNIPRYHDLLEEVTAEAARINQRFQTADWKPIVLLVRQHSHEEILPYYRAADVCLVTSLHDGMNLVAKEFVASRWDDEGVLILSRFTGASHELADALIVNPYDTEDLAGAVRRALEMPPQERRMRMQRMRATVRERNIYRWAGTLMGELCQIRTPSIAPRPALVQNAGGGR